MTIIPDHGRPYVREANPQTVRRWKLTQRNPLSEWEQEDKDLETKVDQLVDLLFKKSYKGKEK